MQIFKPLMMLIIACMLINCRNDSLESPTKETGIKSILELRTMHRGGKTLETKKLSEYDRRGNEIFTKIIKGNKEFYAKLSYNKKNQNILNEGKDAKGVNYKKVMKYDDNDKLIKSEYFKNGILSSTHLFEEISNKKFREVKTNSEGVQELLSITSYDEEDNLTKEEIYQPRDTIIKSYIYDARGNMVEENNKRRFKSSIKNQKYKYDENNLLIEHTSHKHDGTLLSKKTQSYWDDRNLKQRLEIDELGKKNRYSYNEKGLMIEHAYSADDGAWQILQKKEYNEFGHEIKHIKYRKNGDLKFEKSTTYKYDEKENWIETIEKEGDNLLTSIVRTIEYY